MITGNVQTKQTIFRQSRQETFWLYFDPVLVKHDFFQFFLYIQSISLIFNKYVRQASYVKVLNVMAL